ncbi:MAG: Rieske 2Fe-2S domain-containing protein [Hyphomicrobiales bacterium]|nr:Rieske 2Fe-2S domain-containing protein [Hyphomicrobiales bacterium]
MTKLERLDRRAHGSPEHVDYGELVQDDRVHRLLYTDPAIFNQEMRKIFGAVWVYLAHESEIPNRDDYVTARLGLRPIIVTRDSQGTIRALFNRCTHRGTTVCRLGKGSAKSFQCPYHGWTFLNSGKLSGVPWPDGYATDFSDAKFNLAQVPRVESYRGFIFGTLNEDAPPLRDYLGPVTKPIDEWLDRHPGGKVVLAQANRLKYKGNWKLAYDNSADGYHVVFSHRSLLAMENRLEREGRKGMSFYKDSPDSAPMYVQYFGHGHHFKDKRPNINARPGALWEIEASHPGMEHYDENLRAKLGDKADRALDLAASEPVNINVFPNLLILGNHIQVLQPIAVDETDTTWYGTAIIDESGEFAGVLEDINALRMRTQEGFPNFGEVDDLTNFEQIQVGLAAKEDEWIYMHRGMGIPGRVRVQDDGTLIAPATDEVFMREYMKEYKRLMTAEPRLAIRREP